MISFKEKILSAFSAVLFFGWISFVLLNSKSELDYFFNNAKPISVDEIILSSNIDKKMFFSGFSGDEEGFRWSNGLRQKICFRFESDYEKYLLIYEINIVDDLRGKVIKTDLNGFVQDYICKVSICSLNININNANLHDGKYCLDVKLPLTVKVANDDRHLGYQFKMMGIKMMPN